jgi:hypothetical protein
MTTQADGRAERDAALLMLHELSWGRSGRITTISIGNSGDLFAFAALREGWKD